MPEHHLPLLTLLASGLSAAWFLGLIAQRIGLSPIVGYLLAGIVVGPYTPGVAADEKLAHELAELGVLLLMFGVGLHFHLKDLLAVKFIAVPGALVQSTVATIAGGAIFMAFGWNLTDGLVLGMAMAVASTVVLIRVLMDFNQLNTSAGHVAVGWLIVEDVITVLILVAIPALAGALGGEAPGAGAETAAAGATAIVMSLAIAVGKLALMVIVLYFIGSKVVPWILVKVARLRSRELFTLTVLVFSVAVAVGAMYIFDASVALGAFLAGMVVAQSPVSQQAGIDAAPLRDTFTVLFFVTVGMQFDPRFPLQEPWLLLAGMSIVVIAKPLAALLIVVLLGYPIRTALVVAVALSQIGEFSFILGDLAWRFELLPETGRSLLVACALVSITLNPIVFRLVDPMERWLKRRPRLWSLLNGRSERRAQALNGVTTDKLRASASPRAIVVGYGPVGRQVDRLLRQAGMDTIIIDLNMDTVTRLVDEGRQAIFGDATSEQLLAEAGLADASHLVVTMPYTTNRQAMINAVKSINPSVRLLVRTHFLRDEAAALHLGADATVVDELEAAAALTRWVLAEINVDRAAVEAEIARLRAELSSEKP